MNSSNPPIKIAIADDHPLVITGLRHVLENCTDMEITGAYTSMAQALAGIAHHQPHILLLDIQLGDAMGDELAEKIKQEYPQVKILVLTNFDNVFYVRNMLKKGADGYVLKTADESILITAIKTVCAGELYLEPMLKDKLLHDNLQIKNAYAQPPVVTRLEKEILQLVAADMTSQEIANKLFLSKRTIDNYRLSLLMKLGVKNAAGLVKKAIQLGLIS